MWKQIAIVVVIAIVITYLLSPSSQLHTLKGKRVLVTGASGGIGEQIAYQYAKLGASVVVTARRQKELTQVTDKCTTLSPSKNAKFSSVTGDMSNMKDTKKVIEQSIKLMGGLDILVLNHVTGFIVSKYEGSQKRIDQMDFDIDVNFRSYVHLATHALNELKANNGSIIIINSLAARLHMPGMASYVAAKQGINGFFQSLSSDFRTFGGNVSVTNCYVGATGTENYVTKTKQYLGDSGFFIAPQTPDQTAYDAVEAGARRVKRIFTPYLSGRLMFFVYEICPEIIEYLFVTMMGSMENLDS